MRKFLGNPNPKTTAEKNELKAYLKGHEYFSFGKDSIGRSIKHKVRQELYYVVIKK